MNFYTSDLHLFHNNIIRLCNRPYNNIDEMHEDIIKKWNAKVKPTDQVYILGDLSFTCKNIKDLYNILKRLNGQKHLIKGNHDYRWLSDLSKFTNENMFVSVSDYKTIKDNGNHVVLFHYPIEDWEGRYHGAIHLYGHIHNSNNISTSLENRYNVGVDVNNFEPKSLDELINSK